MTKPVAKVETLLGDAEGTLSGNGDARFLAQYFERYRQTLFGTDVTNQLIDLKGLMQATSRAGKKVIIVGNGGSAAIASHCATDLSKNAKIRCVSFNEASLITCLANDFGYDHWVDAALTMYADRGDLIILISSSGKSPNMLRAADFAKRQGFALVTLTGFAPDNPLAQRGDLNFWVDSRAYNIVENIHQIWLLAVCDLLIGSAEYPAAPHVNEVLTSAFGSNS
jgi:D-sedoheptulose 7-phosphate isomerase